MSTTPLRTPRRRTALTLAAALVVVPLAGAQASPKPLPKPDLTVTSLTGAPAALAPGGVVVLSATVTAKGRARSSSTALVLSRDAVLDPSDVALNGAGVATRPKAEKAGPGGKPARKATAVVALTGVVPAGTTPGVYQLLACADAGAKVKEKKETNNCRAVALVVAVGSTAPPLPPVPAGPDTTPPPVPVVGTSPGSPGNDPAPRVTLTGEPGSRVDVYAAAACGGPVLASILLPSSGAGSAATTVPRNATSTFSARATDAAGNVSGCSPSTSYVHDDVVPAVAVLGTLSPSSPSNNPAPSLVVSGDPGSRVDVYVNAACGGAVVASITLPNAGTGSVAVPVLRNTTSTVTARAVDAAGNASACSSTSRSYTHDDVAPAAPVLYPVSQPFLGGTSTTGKYFGSTFSTNVVRAYDAPACVGNANGQYTATELAMGLPLTSQNGLGLGFEAIDPAGNKSGCSLINAAGVFVRGNTPVAEVTSANDSIGQAQALALDRFGERTTVVDGDSSATGDNDWYEVVVPFAGYSLLGQVRSGEDRCTTGMDPVLTVLDGSGAVLATNDQYLDETGGMTPCPRLDGVALRPERDSGHHDLARGTYYVRVGSQQFAPYTYRLVLRLVPTALTETTAADETTQTAQPLPGPHVSVNGTVGQVGDVDVYVVTGPATGRLVLDVVDGPGTAAELACDTGSSSGVDPTVTLFRADGTTVGLNDDNGNLCSRLVSSGLTPGATYYVAVQRAPSAQAGSPTTFAYALTVGP